MSNPQITIKPRQISVTVEQPLTTVLQVSRQGATGASGSSGASYDRTFTQADLSIAALLVVIHGLNSFPSGVAVWSSAGEAIGADRVEVLSADTIAVALESFTPLQGTWTISVTA